MNHFYVYILDRPDTGEPFYVGKGSGDRWQHHLRLVKTGRGSDNPFKDSVIKKLLDAGFEPTVRFAGVDLDEDSAYDLEIETIKRLGLRIKGTGTLTNLTEGGDRPPVGWGRTPSPLQRIKAIENIRGQHAGHKHSEEWKEQHRARHLGKTRSQETRSKLQAVAEKNRTGKSYEEIYGIERAMEIKEKKRISMPGKNIRPKENQNSD